LQKSTKADPMAKVYLETSFISYLASKRSRDLITAGHQQLTQEWWDTRQSDFELYVSQRVIDEASARDEEAAQRRLGFLQGLVLLDLNEEVVRLADVLVRNGPFPPVAAADAVHVAVATVHGIDFLLTWNCRHIANAEIARLAAAICAAEEYEMPKICTPEELMGG
jgi:predicted nucleic acid-binding protein